MIYQGKYNENLNYNALKIYNSISSSIESTFNDAKIILMGIGMIYKKFHE